MSGVLQSEKLKCDCGSEQFSPLVTLLHSPSGGTNPQPAGYQCQQCKGATDIGYLAKRLQAKHAKAKVAELEAQIAAAEAPKPAVKDNVVVGAQHAIEVAGGKK